MKPIVSILALKVHASGVFHPVRQEIIDEVKSKTDKWQPMSPDQNHFLNFTTEEIYSSTGNLDNQKTKPLTQENTWANYLLTFAS